MDASRHRSDVSSPGEALLERALRAAATVDGERVVALAQALVRIRSVVDPDAGATEAACANYVLNMLRAAGLQPVSELVAPNRPNVICDWSGSRFDPQRDRTLLFEGHTDVVTEGDPSRWTQSPYGGTLITRDDGERLYGRGSADMKGGIAAAIGALEAVRATAPDLTGRIRLGIVVDEEGMMDGIKAFIANGWANDVTGAIVCEPEELELCLVQKGAMRVHVHVRGVMAHGAMPYAGVNPITGLMRFLDALEHLQADEQQRHGRHEHLGLPWITPTIVRAPVHGAAQLNVMPDTAYAALDIRSVPEQDHADLAGRLRATADEVAAGLPGLSIELDWFEDRPATETDAADPLVRALEHVYPHVLGGTPRYGGVPGATDGTFLRSMAGVPIVTIGPGDRSIPHQVDEFVRTADLVAAARLYAAAAVIYLSESA